MKPAAVSISKPIPTPLEQRLQQATAFAEKGAAEATKAIKSESARGRGRQSTKGASKAVSEAGKRVFFAPEGDKRLTINLKQELHKKLKILAAEKETTVGDIIEELIERHL